MLHIANDYSGSTVYRNLIRELDKLGICQVIYNPIKKSGKIGNQIQLEEAGSQIIYSHILNRNTDRILYRSKIQKLVADIESKVDLSKISLIHAHTWYSDGGIAYELNRKYNIPYIVAVRNTDINLFLNYRIFDRAYGRKIFANAEKIITISEVYRRRLLQDTRLNKIKDLIEDNLVLIPNGVDKFWIENRVKARKPLKNLQQIQLLYIGKFNRGKNIKNLIKAVINLNRLRPTLFLTLIGGGGSDEEFVKKISTKYHYIDYIGPIYDLNVLKSYFQEADFFTMPSKAETFGLVYVESLLQGVPVLYTKNEGIDGLYDGAIGERVENGSVKEIQAKIKSLVSNDKTFDFNIEGIAKNHNWKSLAKVYSKLYSSHLISR